MGLWERSRLMGGKRMDQEFAEDEKFILYGLKIAGEIDLENGMAPATKTLMLVASADVTPDGGYRVGGAPMVVGTIAGPIAEMASQEAGPDDFPALVSWATVPTKTREKATVLNFHCLLPDVDLPSVPPEWNSV